MDWVSGEGIRDFEFPNSVGDLIWVRDYFGSRSNGSDRAAGASSRPEGVPLRLEDEPRMFLTRRPPGDIIPPHFHEIAQYQVVVEGCGRIGKHDLQSLTVHYTDAYTPYGPIVTGKDGLAFFTIRARNENGGTRFMPGSRQRMPRKAGRAITAHTDLTAQSRELIPMTEDGVESKLIAFQEGESKKPGSDSPGQDRFYVVIGGSLIQDAQEYSLYSCLHLADAEPDPVLTAGSDGAAILVIQFPPLAQLTA